MRGTNRWGLAPGAEASPYTCVHSKYTWVDAGTLTVSSDGTELVGCTLTVFSTVVLIGP